MANRHDAGRLIGKKWPGSKGGVFWIKHWRAEWVEANTVRTSGKRRRPPFAVSRVAPDSADFAVRSVFIGDAINMPLMKRLNVRRSLAIAMAAW